MGKKYVNGALDGVLFAPLAPRPIDDRIVVTSRDSLTDINTWTVIDESSSITALVLYSGMMVAVTSDTNAEDNGIYYLIHRNNYTGFTNPKEGETLNEQGWVKLLSLKEYNAYLTKHDVEYQLEFPIDTSYHAEYMQATGDVLLQIPELSGLYQDQVIDYHLFIDNISENSITIWIPEVMLNGNNCYIMEYNSNTITVNPGIRTEIQITICKSDAVIRVFVSNGNKQLYTVSFTTDPSKGIMTGEVSAKKLPAGSLITSDNIMFPTIVNLTNWLFTGWSNYGIPITQNTTCSAIFTADLNNNGIPDIDEDKVSITFYGGLGTIDGKDKKVYTDVLPGATFRKLGLDLPEVAVDSKYKFLGWKNFDLDTIISDSYLNIQPNIITDVNDDNIDDSLQEHFTIKFEADAHSSLSGETEIYAVINSTLNQNGFIIPILTVDPGYYFVEWEPKNPDLDELITKDIIFTPNILELIVYYQINIGSVLNGSLSVDKTLALAGETVTITPTAAEGYETPRITITTTSGTEITVESLKNGDYEFTMPNESVTITGSFDAKTYLVSITANNANLIINSEEYGESYAVDNAYNTSLNIQVIPNEGYKFISWDDDNIDNPRTFIVTLNVVLTATCSQNMIVGEAVDLGLPSGTLWANMNVGATAPYEYGNYYAWGETETKDTYTWDNYRYGTQNNLTKYNATDGLTTLESTDDAATVNWGGTWRMPTDAELTELKENCTWTWTDNYNNTGVAGRIVTSKTNGNSIFLPAAGVRDFDGLLNAGNNGDYLSSSLNTGDPKLAWFMSFYFGDVGMGFGSRYCGRSVRPVKSPQPTTQIYYNATSDLSKSVGDLSRSVKLVTDSCTYDSVTGDGVLSYDSDVTEIPSSYFRNKSNIRTISFPNSVTSIAHGAAFYGCSSLTSVTIPNSLTNIGDGAFRYCSSLIYVIMGNSVLNIGTEAFCKCSSLTEITLPNSLTNIGYQAFLYCSSLTSVTIPNSVTSISDGAFSNCSSLTLVTIDNSVTNIGKYAFSDCSKLTSITYEGTTEQWNAITKGTNWNYHVPATTVHCTGDNTDVNIK